MNADSGRHQSGTVRLWTFQSAAIVPGLMTGQVHRASWLHPDHNFRFAYEWMAAKLAVTIGQGVDPLVWCWHSCNGRLGSPPTAGTAKALLSDYDFQQGIVAIELEVPAKWTLLSSYYAWNKFLDSALTKKRLPRSRLREQWMFTEPLLKHSDDDIQAVIPCIEPKWVRRIDPLVVKGRDRDEPVLV